jgi:hypothetical protein
VSVCVERSANIHTHARRCVQLLATLMVASSAWSGERSGGCVLRVVVCACVLSLTGQCMCVCGYCCGCCLDASCFA